MRDKDASGVRAKGRKELLRHLEGGRLTPLQAILADCYDCTGGYVDGRADCGNTSCLLYRYMPYRANN